MKNLAFMLFIVVLSLSSCSEENQGYNSRLEDIVEDIVLEEEVADIEEEIIDPSETYPFHGNSCIECQWYFCPPYGAIWQKHICIDNCAEPPIVAYEGEFNVILQTYLL